MDVLLFFTFSLSVPFTGQKKHFLTTYIAHLSIHPCMICLSHNSYQSIVQLLLLLAPNSLSFISLSIISMEVE